MTDPPVREHSYLARNYSKIQKGVYLLLLLALSVAVILVIFALISSPEQKSYPFSPDSDEVAKMVSVTVTGSIHRPGTFELPEGSTVYDALVLAGVKNTADLGNLVLEQRFASSENFIHVDEIERDEDAAVDMNPYIVPLIDSGEDSLESNKGSDTGDETSDIASLNVVNILYVGAPHVFLLASVAPATGNGSFLVIPPQTRISHPRSGAGNQLSHLTFSAAPARLSHMSNGSCNYLFTTTWKTSRKRSLQP